MHVLKSYAVKALLILVLFTILCGLVYPYAVTGLCQVFFKDKANGSILEINGVKYGSELLAQQFTDEKYLWGRMMALNTETFYDGDGNPLMYSGASNKTPAGEELEQMVAERVKEITAAHPEKAGVPIPVDLVTNSGSGLDPHISPAAAEYQVERIARVRAISADEVRAIIAEYTTGRTFGVLGEPAVNVLKVNLALDGIL